MTRVIEVDIAVIGGGLGGVAAAIAAARAGLAVVVTEPTSMIGGQITSQALPALDEHPLIESTGASATYRDVRNRIRVRYGDSGTAFNPGQCWVSRLGFEPEIGLAVLRDIVAEAGDLEVATGLEVVDVVVVDDRIGAVHHRPTVAGAEAVEVRAGIYLDATELGDLLALSGAPWTIGAEARSDTGEPDAPSIAHPEWVQSATVCAIVEWCNDGDHTITRPPGYETLRDEQPFSLRLVEPDGSMRVFPMRETMEDTPAFWTYRRIRAGRQFDPTGATTDLAVINWAGNDYRGSSLVRTPPGPDPAAHRQARKLTRAFIHWLQTEAPRDDGGHGYPNIRLAPEATRTRDGLAKHPYVRESRRLVAPTRVTARDLVAGSDGAVRAQPWTTSGGLAWYAIDVHPRVGQPDSRYDATLPFQVPLDALVAPHPTNLLAAAKNLSASQLAGAAYRTHHGEWSVGEAAGHLAAHSLDRRLAPRRVAERSHHVHDLQRRMTSHGVALYWFDDLPAGSNAWRGANMLAVAGGLDHDTARKRTLSACCAGRLAPADIAGVERAAVRLALRGFDGAGLTTWGSAYERVGAAIAADSRDLEWRS